MLAQVWLIGESASQRYVAQGDIGLQHVLSRQLDATPDHERVRWLSERAPEGAREMRFAELNERAEIRNKHRTGDLTVNIGTYFARLPGAQALSSLRSRLRDCGVKLVAQQRSSLKYLALNRLFVNKLTSGCIEQRDYAVHPFMRVSRIDLRTSQRPANAHIHT
jgi:hypothetical protein